MFPLCWCRGEEDESLAIKPPQQIARKDKSHHRKEEKRKDKRRHRSHSAEGGVGTPLTSRNTNMQHERTTCLLLFLLLFDLLWLVNFASAAGKHARPKDKEKERESDRRKRQWEEDKARRDWERQKRREQARAHSRRERWVLTFEWFQIFYFLKFIQIQTFLIRLIRNVFWSLFFSNKHSVGLLGSYFVKILNF